MDTAQKIYEKNKSKNYKKLSPNIITQYAKWLDRIFLGIRIAAYYGNKRVKIIRHKADIGMDKKAVYVIKKVIESFGYKVWSKTYNTDTDKEHTVLIVSW